MVKLIRGSARIVVPSLRGSDQMRGLRGSSMTDEIENWDDFEDTVWQLWKSGYKIPELFNALKFLAERIKKLEDDKK